MARLQPGGKIIAGQETSNVRALEQAKRLMEAERQASVRACYQAEGHHR